MSTAFDISRILGLLDRLEAGRQPLREATELFWLVSTQDAGAATVVSELLDRMRELSITNKVPFVPDASCPVQDLYLFAHLEAARSHLLLGASGYSEEARLALDNTLSAFMRCETGLRSASPDNTDNLSVPTHPCPERPQERFVPECLHASSLQAVASFAYTMRYSILKADGQYEEALAALSEAVVRCMRETTLPLLRRLWAAEGEVGKVIVGDEDVDDDGASLELWLQPPWPWLGRLASYDPVLCFNAIKARGHVGDSLALSHACIELAAWEDWSSNWWRNTLEQEYLSDPEGFDQPDDYDDTSWGEFWRVASGWVDAQMGASDLRMALQGKQDDAAEERLRRYFFEDPLWDLLPERARRSLISADRDWFSSARTRKESVLNELRIAVGDLLFYGLWIPLCRWSDARSQADPITTQFHEMRLELEQRRQQPDLVHFEKTCQLDMTKAFLRELGISEEERRWLSQRLPKRLRALRLARRHAEHESSGQISPNELGDLFSEFLGIRCEGVLRRLAVLLLPSRAA